MYNYVEQNQKLQKKLYDFQMRTMRNEMKMLWIKAFIAGALIGILRGFSKVGE